MGYEPDPPTRALPQAPRYRGQDPDDPYGGGPVPRPPSGEQPPSEREQIRELEQQVESARTTVTVVAVVAVVALAIAFWALVDGGGGDDEPSFGGDTNGLSSRIDALDDRIDARSTKGDLDKVRKDLEALQTQVTDGSSAGGDADGDDAPDASAVTRVQDDLRDLEERVRRIEDGSGSGGGTGGGSTPLPEDDPFDDPTTTTP
ncbi:MAG: hypothetical protein M0P31_00965 [Solirubrobacteraceae bacterium]|nr:hypothetical protein [Solirubrobacteraceae bacterium]